MSVNWAQSNISVAGLSNLDLQVCTTVFPARKSTLSRDCACKEESASAPSTAKHAVALTSSYRSWCRAELIRSIETLSTHRPLCGRVAARNKRSVLVRQ